MICESCQKNEVTVHYTEIIDGKMVEYHLCEDCARKKGYALTPADAMAELIGSLTSERYPQGDENPACPHCGLTLQDIRSGGRLGCGECYRCFAANLKPLLKALHKGDHHIGKFPASGVKDSAPRLAEEKSPAVSPEVREEEPEQEIARLKREVEKAVAVEDYEKAALLRDQIAALGEKI